LFGHDFGQLGAFTGMILCEARGDFEGLHDVIMGVPHYVNRVKDAFDCNLYLWALCIGAHDFKGASFLQHEAQRAFLPDDLALQGTHR